MTEGSGGQYRPVERENVEKGIQPARVQYQPAPRPASSQIKPPPPAKR